MKTFVGILFLMHLNVAVSQNLVPNPSFEDYSSCPTGCCQLPLAIPWTVPLNNQSEYINSCSIDPNYSVPNQGIYNFQNAHSGNAFIVLILYNGIDNNYREYSTAQLISPLEANKCYFIEFYVNKTSGDFGGKYAINNIACVFTNSAIPINGTNTGNVLNLTPSVLKFGNPIINDTLNWVSISGIYYALGNENYITIGNFMNDSSTDTLDTGDGVDEGSSYFIDDVSVIEVSNLPGSMPAFAGNDATISQLGDSAFIGQEISNLNCNWSILGGSQIATNTSGLYVQPTTTTTYVVEQTLCGTITYDTVTVFVTVGVKELYHQSIFEIYPNPTTGKVFVSSQGIEEGNLTVMVMDITGKEVYNSLLFVEGGSSDFYLNVESGTYIVTITNIITNEKVIKKIVIQK